MREYRFLLTRILLCKYRIVFFVLCGRIRISESPVKMKTQWKSHIMHSHFHKPYEGIYKMFSQNHKIVRRPLVNFQLSVRSFMLQSSLQDNAKLKCKLFLDKSVP